MGPRESLKWGEKKVVNYFSCLQSVSLDNAAILPSDAEHP